MSRVDVSRLTTKNGLWESLGDFVRGLAAKFLPILPRTPATRAKTVRVWRFLQTIYMTCKFNQQSLFIPKLYRITLTDSLLSEKRSQGNVKEILSGQTPTGGHFSCPSLCFKERLSAKPLIWEWFFNIMQIKLSHFHKKGFALASFWKWEFFETGKWPDHKIVLWSLYNAYLTFLIWKIH